VLFFLFNSMEEQAEENGTMLSTTSSPLKSLFFATAETGSSPCFECSSRSDLGAALRVGVLLRCRSRVSEHTA
jgi:hypothetical protein